MAMDSNSLNWNMGTLMEGYSIMEVWQKESVCMVHMHIDLQHSRNTSNNLSIILPKERKEIAPPNYRAL